MTVAREETFGPVAPLFRFSDRGRGDSHGQRHGGSVSRRTSTAATSDEIWRVSEGLEYGIVGVNEGIISNEVAPFGGVKESGIGREGSKYGMDDFVEIKYLCMGGIDG